MNWLKTIVTLILGFGIFVNSACAQDITVYSAPIAPGVVVPEMFNQPLELVDNNVVGYDNGVWALVKLQVPAELVQPDHFIYLSYALLDTLEMWVPDQNGNWQMIHQTGQAFPFDTRPYESSDFVFPVVEGQYDYYFRIYSSKPVVLPIHLESTESLLVSLTHKDLFFGIYVGIILVMFLYNLVLAFITKDNSYAYYILFLISIIMAQLALFGYPERFLFSDCTWMSRKYTVLSGALVGTMTVIFVINFLQLRLKAPKFLKMLYLVFILEVFGVVFLFLDLDVLAYHWVNGTSLYGSTIVIIAAIKLTRQGFKPAKFLLIAWTVLLTTVFIFALTSLGVIPYRPYFLGAMLFGSSVEVILLSIALADRINVLRGEKEASQAEALKMAKENERIIREQNTILEEQVQKRTEELQGANKELKVTLSDLQNTQTQLIEAEKMASLGILTAGVAHEINNPLNFIYGGFTAIDQEIGKDGDLDRENIREYLGWIKTGAEKATKIVKSLNVYSRNNEDLSEKCELNTIVDRCLSILQPKIGEHIVIQKSLDEGLPSIQGNNGKLHQVIMNLLSNAIDAVTEDGVIHIKTTSTNTEILLAIEDNGCGIQEDDLKKVMDPFYTTKPPGEGTGLGLSISKSIILKHKGKLSLNSKAGQGTSVRISLPKNIENA